MFDIVHNGFPDTSQAGAFDTGKAADFSMVANYFTEFCGVHRFCFYC